MLQGKSKFRNISLVQPSEFIFLIFQDYEQLKKGVFLYFFSYMDKKYWWGLYVVKFVVF